MVELIYKELSHRIIGLCYQVYNELGYGYQEKYYARVFALLLKELGIKFKQEPQVLIKFHGRIIGKYFIDFVIEDKIAIEFKIDQDFRNQLYSTNISLS